jgi:glycine cleavage system H lipoate-binding protein
VVNTDPYGEGWMLQVEPLWPPPGSGSSGTPAEGGELLDEAGYSEFTKGL